jgi:two-component system nitrogen regulation sensor histidine kinase GlnL
VWADREALLQAFLNIARNSQRALEGQVRREFAVCATASADFLTIRFVDSGPGVDDPELLFQAFQPGAQSSGLGLFLSQSFVRAFRGYIEYEPRPDGCCFAVTLALASVHEDVAAELA